MRKFFTLIIGVIAFQSLSIVNAAPNTGSSQLIPDTDIPRKCGTTKVPDLVAEKLIANKVAEVTARIAAARVAQLEIQQQQDEREDIDDSESSNRSMVNQSDLVDAVIGSNSNNTNVPKPKKKKKKSKGPKTPKAPKAPGGPKPGVPGIPAIPLEPKRIDVYVHVVQNAPVRTALHGFIPAPIIEEQIAVMNRGYSGFGFVFRLVEINYVVNAQWFHAAGPGTAAQAAMKKALRKGNASVLNLYSVGFTHGSGRGILGFSTFPETYSKAPSDDGVVFLHSTVPGGAHAVYNQGMTVLHETGHWLGQVLYAEAVINLASPSPDYSSDICMNTFTVGQAVRMISQVEMYRGL